MNWWKRLIAGLSESEKQADAQRSLWPMLKEAHELVNHGEYEKARPILLKAVELRNHLADARTIDCLLCLLEATWLFQDKFEDQIQFFSKYIERYPADCSAYRARGAAFWYLEQLREALAEYSRAIELNSTDILSRSGRGQVLAELGESEKAIDDLDVAFRLLAAAPKANQEWIDWCKSVEAFVYRGRGVAIAARGQFGEAVNEFDRSVTLSPDNAWAYYSRAQVYDRVGDHQRAFSDYRVALEKTKPRLAPAQRERARARIQSSSS